LQLAAFCFTPKQQDPRNSFPLLILALNIKYIVMVTRLSHTSFFVNDQEKAFDFYVNKLGFKVHTDATMDNGFRWLTVTTPEQPDLEIILFPANSAANGFDEDVQKALKLLLDKGVMGAGALYTPDVWATYRELSAKGVQFKSEPKEQFYGIECIVSDGCGNWFSMTQPKEGM
jgi:catechol 2,3-dioxygenase-like lactoylglutathione lyase family enzyme